MEFKSKLEDVMPADELDFPPTLGFGPYKNYLEHAVQHPAKANTYLLEFLIRSYTKPGDVVLDPMAGSGSTCVVAALHGRNAVCVDIEPRFYEWMEEARRRVENAKILTPKGWIRNILGDARKLSELLKELNENLRGRRAWEEKRISSSDENIGELPLGSIDTIITSPPYADTKKGGEASPEDVEEYARRWEENVVRRGWDSWSKSFHTPGRLRGVVALKSGYSGSPDNIGNLPLGSVDAIITSPPYGELNRGGGIAVRGYEGRYGRDERLHLRHARRISDSPDNISNIPFSEADARGVAVLGSGDSDLDTLARRLTKDGRPTYLSEMLRVYGEMFRVLKPGGLAIVIVKPFIRERRAVDLPYYTWLLLERAGFKLEKLYKLRLKKRSFWSILYYMKHPEVPVIAHEYVLICRKPGVLG